MTVDTFTYYSGIVLKVCMHKDSKQNKLQTQNHLQLLFFPKSELNSEPLQVISLVLSWTRTESFKVE